MTHSPPQLHGRRLIVLGVHGFPQLDLESGLRPRPYLDPRAQLYPIRQAIEQADKEVPVEWLDCPWLLGGGESVGKLPETLIWDGMDAHMQYLADQPKSLLLKNRIFSNMYLDTVDIWLRECIGSIDRSKSDAVPYIVIIAYSGGGLLVYRWLAERAPKDLIKDVEAIFCIAAPFYFSPDQMVTFTMTLDNRQSRPFPVRETSAKPEKIVQYLRPEQLVVLLAEDDKTVLLANSSFRENNFQAQQILEPPPIVGANHLTILTHVKTKEHILKHLHLR